MQSEWKEYELFKQWESFAEVFQSSPTPSPTSLSDKTKTKDEQ